MESALQCRRLYMQPNTHYSVYTQQPESESCGSFWSLFLWAIITNYSPVIGELSGEIATSV